MTSTASFTVLALTGQRALVRGTDFTGMTGETVLDSTEWTNVKAQLSHRDAHSEFDEAVEEFFAPLMAAVEKLQQGATPAGSSDEYVTLVEGTEAQQGQDEVRIQLNHDSIVLRLVERGDFGRLVWVNGTLEVLEVLDFNESDEPTVTTEPAEAPSEGTMISGS